MLPVTRITCDIKAHSPFNHIVDLSLFEVNTVLTNLSFVRINWLFNCPSFNVMGSTDAKSIIINLWQLNAIANLNNKLLDLVFTNTELEITVVHDLSPFVVFDVHHPALTT